LWVGDLVCRNRDCHRRIAVCAGKDQQSPEYELEDSRRNSSPTPQLGTRSKKRAEIPSIIGGLRSGGYCTDVQILADIWTVKKLRAIHRPRHAILRPQYSAVEQILVVLLSLINKWTAHEFNWL
jgi:hypothetical protein